jgi:hypothetical protein
MRPFEVNAGEWAPDVELALEKAKDMLKSVERDDSAIRNVRGVEETQAAHYWTNQQLPETDIESVSKKASSAENVKMIDGNPHQTGSTLAMHENNAGGNAHPSEALTKAIADREFRGGDYTGEKIEDYNEPVELAGRQVPPRGDEAPRTMDPMISSLRRRLNPLSDVGSKSVPRDVQVMPRPSPGDTGGQNFSNPAAQGFGFEPAPSFTTTPFRTQPQAQTSIGAPKQQQRLPAPGQSSVQTGRPMNLSWRMLKQGPLDALMGGGPPDDGPGPMGDMDDKPSMGGDDDDAQSLASRIKGMIDQLADKAGDDKPDMPDMDDDMEAGPTLKAISAIIHKGKKCPGCGKQMGVDKGMCKGAGDC